MWGWVAKSLCTGFYVCTISGLAPKALISSASRGASRSARLGEGANFGYMLVLVNINRQHTLCW